MLTIKFSQTPSEESQNTSKKVLCRTKASHFDPISGNWPEIQLKSQLSTLADTNKCREYPELETAFFASELAGSPILTSVVIDGVEKTFVVHSGVAVTKLFIQSALPIWATSAWGSHPGGAALLVLANNMQKKGEAIYHNEKKVNGPQLKAMVDFAVGDAVTLEDALRVLQHK